MNVLRRHHVKRCIRGYLRRAEDVNVKKLFTQHFSIDSRCHGDENSSHRKTERLAQTFVMFVVMTHAPQFHVCTIQNMRGFTRAWCEKHEWMLTHALHH
jgi:hypothetical protein